MTGHLVPTLRKADRQRRGNAGNSALIGSGATVGGVGLVAGGIPGKKADFTSIFARHADGSVDNTRTAASQGVRGVARAARRATGGGILGFRAHAHMGGTEGFEQDKREYDAAPKKKVTTKLGHEHPEGSRERGQHTYGSSETASGSYYRGLNDGKIGPEKRILRGMKTGRKVAHGALGAGAAAVGVGLVRRKREMSKADSSRSYSGALIGTGLSGAAISHGGAKYLGTQGKRYANRSAMNVDEAGRVVPALAGRRPAGHDAQLRHMRRHGKDAPQLLTMYPKVGDGAVAGNSNLMRGVAPKKAREAGRLRGAAAQERHFAEVFNRTAKVTRAFRTPSLVAAGAGAGGLAAMKEKKRVTKALADRLAAGQIARGGRLVPRKGERLIPHDWQRHLPAPGSSISETLRSKRVTKGLKLSHRVALGHQPMGAASGKGAYARSRLAARYQSFNSKIPGSDFKAKGRAFKENARAHADETGQVGRLVRVLP